MPRDKACTTELLAPAGDYECFLAAIRAGADAVYLSGNRFGARAYAANLNEEELLAAIDYAHLYDRKLYLTVNTVLKNKEMVDLYDYMAPLYEAGLDGVIVQDIGVLKYLRDCFKDLPLHASTQMAITSAEGFKLLKDMGVSRVVPARELSLEEIRDVYEETGMEIECFIHGALCYSYSGKCLFSSLVGGRSGNRGRCAQPCRLPYNDKYILSARDISTLNILPDLIESGICSFKIEGRMKSKEYVAGVTGIYRKYIDLYYSFGRDGYKVDPYDLKELDDLYTRSGHCEGYYHETNGRDMITIDKPSYNTPDDDRMQALYERFTGCFYKLKCSGTVRARLGEGLSAAIEYRGCSVECEGPVVDKALKQPTDPSNIRKHFEKTGDTPFEFDDLKIEADDDIFIPVSSLNSLRRDLLSALKDEILKGYRRRPGEKRNTYRELTAGDRQDGDRPLVNVSIERPDLLDCVLKSSIADIVTLNRSAFKDEGALKAAADKIHEKGAGVFIALPYVIRHKYFKKNNLPPCDGVIIDNYESLYYLKSVGFKGTVLADLHLYCTNDISTQALYELGADVLTYPVELNAGELRRLNMPAGDFILYGKLPMMVSAQCTGKTQGSCLKDNGISYIKDRYGNDFAVIRNCSECYNTILNCLPLMIKSGDEIPSGIKPYSFRISFTDEDEEQVRKILKYYRDLLDGRSVDDPGIKRTLGHLKRGVE
ncbi:MAG: U32 family peptidase [Lachnospiraceae bacterium]|nr:U32 family peptidase [Lachnospiraceae bacterium]